MQSHTEIIKYVEARKNKNIKSLPQNFQQIVSTMTAELANRKADATLCNTTMNYQSTSSGHAEFLVITEFQSF